MDILHQLSEDPRFLFALFVLTLSCFLVIGFHAYRFLKLYRLNRQVDRIIAVHKYQRNQELADSIDNTRERVIDELSAFRLEKQPDGTYRKFYHVKESDVEIL